MSKPDKPTPSLQLAETPKPLTLEELQKENESLRQQVESLTDDLIVVRTENLNAKRALLNYEARELQRFADDHRTACEKKPKG